MKAVGALAILFFFFLAVCSAAEPAKETLKTSAASFYGAYPYAYSGYGGYPYGAGFYPYNYGAYAYSGYPYSAYPYYY